MMRQIGALRHGATSTRAPVHCQRHQRFPHTFQAKAIFYSYEACGEKDKWTGGNREACVNQKTGGACMRYDKCAWTGSKCLGKELVEVCGVEDKSASWSPRAIMALALPLLVLRCSL